MTSIENVLITSENKIKSFFNGIPIPTYAWQKVSDNLILIDYNAAAFNETRGEIKKYVGVKAADFYKDFPDIITDLNQCVIDQKHILREMKYSFTSTSEERFISAKYGFLFPDLVLVYMEDITSKKHLEDQLKESQRMLQNANKKLRQRVQKKTKELKESEHKYRLISENANDLLIMTNERYEPEYVNEQALKSLLGYSEEDVIGLSGLKFIHPDDIQTALKNVKKGIKEGQGVAEIRYRHKEGYYVWMEATGKTFTDDMGELKGIVILRDITKRKSLEEKLKESEENYRLITEESNDLIKVLNEKFEIEYVNDLALQNFIGYTKQELLGKNTLILNHPNDYTEVRRFMLKLFKVGEKTHETRIKHKNGKWLWVENKAKMFTDEKGNQKYLFISRDITERKKTEKALLESEEKYRHLFDTSPFMTVLINPSGEIIDFNKTSLKYLIGYSRDDLIGKIFLTLEFMKESHLDILKEIYSELLNNGYSAPIEFKVDPLQSNLAGTNLTWIELQCSLFTVGKEKLIQVIIKDISAEKEAELKLKESEEKYRLISENANDIISISNSLLRLEYVNEEPAFRLTGYKNNEVLGKIGLDFIHPEDRDKVLKAFFKGLRTGQALVEARLHHKSGYYIWVEISAKIFRDQKGKAKFLLISRDITERKNAEEQVRESEEMFRKFFEESQDGVLLTDESGYIRKWNKGQERIFGTRKAEIIGSPVWDAFFMQIPEKLKTSKRYEFLQSTIENFLKTGRAPWLNQLQEIDIQKTDGTYQCIQQRPFSIKTRKGYMLGSVNRDITERKLAEQKLKESEEKYRAAYEQADFYKNLFVHDISNILTVIDWSSQISSQILQKQETLEDLNENMVRIGEQINKAKNLIKNVQKLSEINDIKTIVKPIEICKILKECVNYIYDSFRENTIKIEVKSPKNTYLVNANELLADVFENIFINGIKYNQNSVIKITVEISVEEKNEESFLKMEFLDNGIGIQDERKEIIFQKRFEKDKYSKGMGFGLTLVKKIIESYKGEIWIDDRIPGDYTQGSNFVILIPLIEKESLRIKK